MSESDHSHPSESTSPQPSQNTNTSKPEEVGIKPPAEVPEIPQPSRSTLVPDLSRGRRPDDKTVKQSRSGPSVLMMIALALGAALVGILVAKWLMTPGEVFNKELMAELVDVPLQTQFLISVEDETEWPQWRGPYRDGIAYGADIITDWPQDLLKTRKAWEVSLGDGYSSVVVANKRAYTMVQDGVRTEAVICWDAESGKELWRFRYEADYQVQFGPSPRSTPSIDGDRIYTVSGNGILHCLKTKPNSTKGEKVWSVDLIDEFDAQIPRWGVSFSPLVLGGLVYVTPGGQDGRAVAALDKLTGETKWTAFPGTAGYSSPVAAVIGGKEQVLFMTGNGIGGLSPQDGSKYWWYDWRTPHKVNAATPIVARDHVFISSGYGRGCALLKIGPKDDETIGSQLVYATRGMNNHFNSSVLHDEHLYGFDDQYLTCMNLRTAKVKWKVRATQDAKNLGKGSVLLVKSPKPPEESFTKNHLIVLSDTGRLVFAKAQPEKYEQLHEVQVFQRGECWTVPTLAKGRLYLRSKHRLVCLDLRRDRSQKN
ncbi:MAG: PQQ-binding-like beta-propeller repeat protein [Gemmataceae bacterium]